MSYTIQGTPKISYIPKPLHFGQTGKPDQGNIQHTPQNGVWITTERSPAKVGGLGEVSKTIPEAFAQFMPKKDLRIIVPYLGKHRDDDESKKAALAQGKTDVSEQDIFQPTGAQLNFETDDGRQARLEVLQKFEDATGFKEHNQSRKDGEKVGNWVYALRNDDYFMGKNEYGVEAEKGLSDYTYSPEAGEFDKVMLFNKGAKELVPLLDGNSTDPRAARLSRFNNLHKAQAFPDKKGVKAPANQDFRKNIDFVITHDWLTGAVSNELPDLPYTRKHFVVHNMFDKEQAPHVALRTGLLTPPRLFNQERTFSALNAGIEPSDSIWVNNNFKKTVLESTLPNGAPFINTLRQKSEAGRTHNLHHGLSLDYTASGPQAPACLEESYTAPPNSGKKGWLSQAQSNQQKLTQNLNTLNEKAKNLKAANKTQELKLLNKSITKAKADLNKVTIQIKAAQAGHAAGLAKGDDTPYQFQKLAVNEGQTLPTPAQMQTFKAANKAALQKKLGLKQDPDATIIAWAARLDPRQKNVYLFMKSVEEILENDPEGKVQFVVVGDTSDPQIIEWINGINKKYNTDKGENRVYIPNVFANQDEVKQINAGADFTALPSLYEPYGLTQLEAMKMGSLPIVHGVDGLRSTVSDPEMNEKLKALTPPDEWEAVWEKDQNGILMEPVDIDECKAYIDDRQDFEALQALKSKLDQSKEPLPKDDPTTLADWKKKQDEALKALMGKMEGLASTFKHKLESFQLQSTELNQALQKLTADGTLTPKRETELNLKIQWLKQQTMENSPLSRRAQQAQAAYQEVLKNPDTLETEYERIKKLVEPDENTNVKAAAKLTHAIHRGIDLLKDKEKNSQIRIDAIDYVNTEHDWKNILQKYYQPALENDSLDTEIRTSRSKELKELLEIQAALKPPGPENKSYAQTRPGASAKPSGFSETMRYYWNTFWNMNQKFWAAIGRLVSLRKD
ncbi:glycosyltransferase [Vampirovibrio sp.]|uniref:glycosyltransferase n=1 Tax=Vampirovibrio sp. TaxID=2717857 RepID=UPI003593BF64